MKKYFKRVIALMLGLVIMIPTVFCPDYLVANAEEDKYNKLQFTPKELTKHESIAIDERYPYMLGDNPDTTDCAIQKWEIIVSEGYTNLLAYDVPSDGKIRLGYSNWGNANFTLTLGNSDLEGRVAEFCITDVDGHILYPTDGKVAILNEENPSHLVPTDQLISVSEGKIYFVIHSVSGVRNSFEARNIVHFLPKDGGETQLMDWSYWPMENVMSDFAFEYAEDCEKVLEEGEKYNKLQFTANVLPKQESVAVDERYPFMLGDNPDVTDCAIQKWEIIASEGYTNLLAYNVPSDGNIRLGYSNWGNANFTLTLGNSDLEGRVAEFCITDANGNILYPTDGKVAILNEENPSHLVPTDQLISVSEGKIYFVIHSVSGVRNSFEARNIVHFLPKDGGETQLMDWSYWPMENVMSDFAFEYAENCEKVWVDKESGGETPGGEAPGGETPGGETPGGGTPGEGTPGDEQPEPDEYNKLQFTLNEMTESDSNYPFMYDGINCATQRYEMVVSKGYANVITYKAPSDGMVYFGGGNVLSPWGDIQITLGDNVSGTRKIEFCIADNEGNILYPANYTVATIDDGETHKFNDIAIPVTKDSELNLIFRGVSGTKNSFNVTGYLQFISNDGTLDYATESWRVYPNAEVVEQGTEDFYFKYSTDCRKIWDDSIQKDENPTGDGSTGDGSTDEEKPGVAKEPEAREDGYVPTYKINFEAAEMTSCDIINRFKWTMPGKEFICMTNPSGEKIVSGGYANIVTWTAKTDGELSLRYGTFILNNPDAGAVLFAITDKEGNILYPTNGTMVMLNSEQKIKQGIYLSGVKMKAGDEINFVFEGIRGETLSLNFECELYYKDATGEHKMAQGPICPVSKETGQHVDGWSYRYAKSFENKIIGYVEPISNTAPGVATEPVTRADGYVPTYKIKFDAREMISCNIIDRFKWTMPEKEFICMTNPSGEKIVSGGYANIVTWTAKTDGELSLKYGTFILNNPDAGAVLFAITDKEGNILYPTNGTMVMLNSQQTRKESIFLSGVKMKAGDEINFVFEGIRGETLSLNFECELYYKDATGEHKIAQGPICPVSKEIGQHVGGWSYRYAKSFENIITGYVFPSESTSYRPDIEGTEILVSEDDNDFISTNMLVSADGGNANQSDDAGAAEFMKTVKSIGGVVGIVVAIAGIAFIGNTIIWVVKKRKQEL